MTLRNRRYNYYRANHFTHFEALDLSTVPFTSVRQGKRAYNVFIRDMVKARRQLVANIEKEAEFNKWSGTRQRAELRKAILFEYKENDWLIKRPKAKVRMGKIGYPDPYQMMDYFRDKAIKEGRWTDTPTYIRHKKRPYVWDEDLKRMVRLDKQKLRQQKARQKAKEQKSPLSDRPYRVR